MANKLFGIADPYYDALRVQSNQAIWPDAGGSNSGIGGALENKIYLWQSDGSTISTYDATQAGLIAALAAASSGDTVWLPSIEIAVTTSITLIAGVWLSGIDAGAAINLTANDASSHSTVVGPATGAAYLSHVAIRCTNAGSGDAIALDGAAGQVYTRDCYFNGTSTSGAGYGVRSGDGTITIDDSWILGSTAPIAGGGSTYSPGAEISTGSITVASPTGDAITGLTPGNWYCVEAYNAMDRWPGGGSSWSNEIGLSNDSGSTWSGRYGANSLADSSANIGPQTGYSTDLPSFAAQAEFWGTPATRPRIYWHATTTSIKIRVWDTFWDDNVGSLSWRLRAVTIGTGTTINVITHSVRMQQVQGEPALGDRGAWDTTTWFDRHASDIADHTFTYHRNPDADDSSTARVPIEVMLDGRLAVVSDILPAYIVTADQSINSVLIHCMDKGSASSTIVDVHRNGTTIFTTQANRPTLAYNASANTASGTPDVTDLLLGDELTFDIDQTATAAERLTIVVLTSAAGIPVTPPPTIPPQTDLDGGKPGTGTDNIVLQLGTAGAWDDSQILHPCAVEYGGTIYLYYSGQHAGGWQIGVATAATSGFTGVNFTKYGSNPIIPAGGVSDWDYWGAMNPWVIYDSDAGLWKMWYRGYVGGVIKIGYATASNPLGPWTKYASNPIIAGGGGWEGTIVHLPAVLRESSTDYKMLYTGNEPASNDGRIGFATSTDGIAWTKYGSNPVITPGGGGWMNVSVFSSRTLYKSGSTYYTLFSGKQTSSGASKNGGASSTDLITWTLNANNPLLTATRTWEGVEVENPNTLTLGHDQYVFYDAFAGSPATIGVSKIVIP